jgi:hypothetical protein
MQSSGTENSSTYERSTIRSRRTRSYDVHSGFQGIAAMQEYRSLTLAETSLLMMFGVKRHSKNLARDLRATPDARLLRLGLLGNPMTQSVDCRCCVSRDYQ